jgi:hypothetical protein
MWRICLYAINLFLLFVALILGVFQNVFLLLLHKLGVTKSVLSLVNDFLYFFNSNSEVIGTKSEMRTFFSCILTFSSFFLWFIREFTGVVDRIVAFVFSPYLVGGSFSGKIVKVLLIIINPVLTVVLAGYTVFFVVALWIYRTFSFLFVPIITSFVLFLLFIFATTYSVVTLLLNFISCSRIGAITTVLPICAFSNRQFTSITARAAYIRMVLFLVFVPLMYYVSSFSWFYLFDRYHYYSRHHPFGHGLLWSDSPYRAKYMPASLATQASPFGSVFSNFDLFEWVNAHAILLSRLQYILGASEDVVVYTIRYQLEVVYMVAGIVLLVLAVFYSAGSSNSFLARSLRFLVFVVFLSRVFLLLQSKHNLVSEDAIFVHMYILNTW